MNPEENFRRLRDESLWNDIPIPQGKSARRSERRLWPILVPVLSGLVVAALVVTGVSLSHGADNRGPEVAAPAPAQTSTPVPPVTEPPAQTATPAPSNTLSPAAPSTGAPPQLFDGDCENVLPQSRVDDIVGTTMSNDSDLIGMVMGEYDGDLWSAPGFVTRQIGGLSCAWFSEETQALINFTFVPADRVKAPTETGRCLRDVAGWDGCTTNLVRNGVQIRGMVGQTGGPEDARIAKALVTLVDAAIKRLDTVTGHVQGPDDWSLPVDCGKLGSATSLGKAEPLGGMDIATGTDQKYADLLNFGVNLQCEFTSGIAVYRPGGAWAEPRIAALDGARELDVDGFDNVIVVERNGYTIYNFFRGTNWLYVDQSPTKKSKIIRFATEVADGLDDLRH